VAPEALPLGKGGQGTALRRYAFLRRKIGLSEPAAGLYSASAAIVLDARRPANGTAVQDLNLTDNLFPHGEIRQPSSAPVEHIDRHYSFFDAIGNRIDGMAGFEACCLASGKNVAAAVKAYWAEVKTLEAHRRENGFVDASFKISEGNLTGLDELWYGDFYGSSFGKTRLGMAITDAKAFQDPAAMDGIWAAIGERLGHFVADRGIEGMAAVPPTAIRNIQVVTYLGERIRAGPLNGKPIIRIERAPLPRLVQQKTLRSRADRVANADRAFVVPTSCQVETVLLFDDVASSGATMDEIAKKIKNAGVARKVIGFAVAGSHKGFDVEPIV
jgi:hypothetical protein